MGVNGYQTVGGSFRRILTQPPGRKTSVRLLVLFFFASVEILLDILADNTKKNQQVPWAPSFQGNLTAAPAALLTPPAVVRTHIFKGAVAMDGEGRDEESLGNTLLIPGN